MRAQSLPNFPPPQTFLPHGLLPSSTPEQYHVRLDRNSPYTVGIPQPRTLASSYSTFDHSAYLSQDSLRTICDTNDIFWMDLHSNMSAPEFADQPHAHLTSNDMQRLIQSPWPTNSCGGLLPPVTPGRLQSTPDSKALWALRHQTAIPRNRPHRP